MREAFLLDDWTPYFWPFIIAILLLVGGVQAVKDMVSRALARCPHGVRGGRPCRLCDEERLRAEQVRQNASRQAQEKARQKALALEAERLAEIARLKEEEFSRLLEIEDTRALQRVDPYVFEELCATLYRRMGWQAHTTRKTGDGGIDVIVTKAGETRIIQCKCRTQGKVGVGPVRDLFGVVTAESAAGGILMTNGTFTEGAITWAQKRDIQLIDGTKIAALIREHLPTSDLLPDACVLARMKEEEERKREQQAEQAFARLTKRLSEPCPRCGKALTLRRGRRGAFLGCTGYPTCMHTSDVADNVPPDRAIRKARVRKASPGNEPR